jgi:hypothetical protein
MAESSRTPPFSQCAGGSGCLILLKLEVIFHMRRCRLAMIPFSGAGLSAGRVAVAPGGRAMALLVGLPVAGVVYTLASRSMDLGADRRRAEAADAGLE